MAPIEPEIPARIPPSEPEAPHSTAILNALQRLKKELSSNEGWTSKGESDGVDIYVRPDEDDPSGVPTVKGEALIPNITASEFLAIVQLPGMRKRWDPRLERSIVLERYNRSTYKFYSLTKGVSFIVSGRDFVGVGKVFVEGDEVFVVQTSIVDDERAPEQSGKVRAHLTVAGWYLKTIGSDLKVTYLAKVSLNGSLPGALVGKLAQEMPSCVGRVRNVYESIGYAPYFVAPDDSPIIWQSEAISDPNGSKVGPLEYRCKITTAPDSQFELKYSSKMYPKGVKVRVEGGGAQASDEGNGSVKVICTEGGKVATVVISPK